MGKIQQNRAFTKEQLTKANRYSKRQDLLTAILSDEQEYTTDEVDKLINDFMKGVI